MGGIAHVPVSVLLTERELLLTPITDKQIETVAHWIVQSHVAAAVKKIKRLKP